MFVLLLKKLTLKNPLNVLFCFPLAMFMIPLYTNLYENMHVCCLKKKKKTLKVFFFFHVHDTYVCTEVYMSICKLECYFVCFLVVRLITLLYASLDVKCKAEDFLPSKVIQSVTLQLNQYAQHVSLMTLQVWGKLVELHELNELLQCKFTTVLQHFCSGSAADGA